MGAEDIYGGSPSGNDHCNRASRPNAIRVLTTVKVAAASRIGFALVDPP